MLAVDAATMHAMLLHATTESTMGLVIHVLPRLLTSIIIIRIPTVRINAPNQTSVKFKLKSCKDRQEKNLIPCLIFIIKLKFPKTQKTET